MTVDVDGNIVLLEEGVVVLNKNDNSVIYYAEQVDEDDSLTAENTYDNQGDVYNQDEHHENVYEEADNTYSEEEYTETEKNDVAVEDGENLEEDVFLTLV